MKKEPNTKSSLSERFYQMETKKDTQNGRQVIVGSGLISLDAVFVNGNTIEPKYWAGGTCGNVITILAYLGWNSYPVGIIGKDEASKLVYDDMRSFGVFTDFLENDEKHLTPIVIEHISKNHSGLARHRFILTCPNCGKQLPRYQSISSKYARVLSDKLPKANVFFFDRVSQGVLEVAKTYANKGCLIVFEPSGIKDPELFQEAVSICHIMKYSHQRFVRLKPPDYSTPLLEIETFGELGLRYRLGHTSSVSIHNWQELKAFSVDLVRDAAGAGDWCTSGILYTLGLCSPTELQKVPEKQVIEALQVGQALAALNCGFEGARGVMYSVTSQQLIQKAYQIISSKLVSEPIKDEKKQAVEILRYLCPKCNSRKR